MRYFNKDYANFIVDDEKEKRLIDERNRRKAWRLDPELKLEYQKKLVKHGKILVVLWIGISLLYLAMSLDYYHQGYGDRILRIGYPLMCVLGALGAIINYHELRKAEADVRKIAGAAKS